MSSNVNAAIICVITGQFHGSLVEYILEERTSRNFTRIDITILFLCYARP